MGKDDLGEPSRKVDGNDDERPFKKARYVWEVKGKYHLKDAYKLNRNECSNSKDESTFETAAPVESNETEEVSLNSEMSSMNNNNNNCSDRCCIEAFLARSDVLMDSDDSADTESSQKNIDKSISDEIPVTLVKFNLKSQDYYLRRWQARQVAKGFVDNTINRVLEHWMVAPFDAADLVENCDNDGQVEDEGIMMAIQSHGLRSGFGKDASFQNQSSLSRGECECSGHHSNSKGTPISFVRPQEIAESTLDNYENVYNERIKQNIETITEPEKMSCDDQPSQIDAAPNGSVDNLEIDDPTDFLNAAVSVAIQKKGLSSYSYG